VTDKPGQFAPKPDVDSDVARGLRAVANAAQEIILLCSSDNRIVHANSAASDFFGCPGIDLIGRDVNSLIFPKATAPDEATDEVAARAKPAIALTRERGEVAVEIAREPVDVPMVDWEVVSVRDVSERNRLAEEIAIARDQAKAANKSRSEFLAMMSHELRTPLNAVIGYSEIIKEETFGPVGSPKYREYVDDIHNSGCHLLNIINDILDLSKLETGGLELRETNVAVGAALEASARLVRERATNDGVTLEMTGADDLPPLRADERKLKQIIVSLLSNAIKFSHRGGTVTLNAWCRPDSGYVFQVADTGIGMALEDIPKALAPFGQIDSDLNRRYEGTGIGLPLTKALVEMHSGSIDVQSKLGAGTTVTVRFPAERIGVASGSSRVRAI
jgi:PAS domain S-box-containing protein